MMDTGKVLKVPSQPYLHRLPPALQFKGSNSPRHTLEYQHDGRDESSRSSRYIKLRKTHGQ